MSRPLPQQCTWGSSLCSSAGNDNRSLSGRTLHTFPCMYFSMHKHVCGAQELVYITSFCIQTCFATLYSTSECNITHWIQQLYHIEVAEQKASPGSVYLSSMILTFHHLDSQFKSDFDNYVLSKNNVYPPTDSRTGNQLRMTQ